MSEFSNDIYTEPEGYDRNTLNNLGPLARMAGIWTGQRGLDIKPKADGPRKQAYVERIELQPIDPVTNGPQLFYGLRYLIIVNKPDQPKTYHEQVGYWLWEPETYGIRSNPFLEHGFKTVEYRIKVSFHEDGSWSYEEDTVMLIRGQEQPFHHLDRNHLHKVAEPTPNPQVSGQAA